MQTQKKTVMSLLWIMIFDHTCLNITFPILTLLFFDLKSSLFSPDTSHAVRSMWYGLCVSIPHVVNIAITPFLSAWSDEYGRKKLLLVGTLGALLFAVTAGFGILYGMMSLLFLGRFIQGAFSRTTPIAQAVIGDVSTKEDKVLYMGYLQTAVSIGAFIGPIIGGYFANRFFFAELNYSLPYFIAAIFGLISFILTLTAFDETHTNKNMSKKSNTLTIQQMKSVFSQSGVWRISMILLLSQISWSLYYQFMPPILKTTLDFDAHALGLFVGLIAFWLALATSLGIKLLKRYYPLARILTISLYLVLIGLVLSYLFCYISSGLVWIAAIPTAVGDVVAYSCITAIYSNVVDQSEQGKVMGICFMVVALIWACTAILGGMLMSMSTLLPLLLSPLGIVFAIGLMRRDSFKAIVK